MTMIEPLVILYNIQLLQPSIFKCISKSCKSYYDRSNVSNTRLKIHSFSIFCYFNISPAVFFEVHLQKKIEKDIIISDDTAFLKLMNDIGWNYNYKTMLNAVKYGVSVNMMKALRDLGCHWGSETLYEILKNCTYHSDGRGDQNDLKTVDMKNLLDFAITDGYPVTIDHLMFAVEICHVGAMRSIINGISLSSLYIPKNILRTSIQYRINKSPIHADDITNFRKLLIESAIL